MKTATARLPRSLLGGSDSGFNAALLFPLGLLAFMILAPLISPNRAPLGLLLQGAEAGGVNGLLALGLVLTYRANRVINFSYASMGALAGTFGLELHLGQHWNWWASMAVGLLIGGLLGALTELLLRWRFQKVPRLVVMVATIGLAQLFSGVQVLVPGWLKGPEFLGSFNTSLSTIHFYIRPTLFNGNDIFIMAVVLLAPLVIGWFLVRTNTGIAVRSMADNPDRARLLGIPLHRISLMVWIIAGVLSALTVLVNAPFQGVSQGVLSGPELLLPALAAAVIARMENLPVAFWSGIGLGILNAVVEFNVQQAAVTDVALTVVVLLALLIRRTSTGRGREEASFFSSSAVARPIPEVLRRLPEIRIGKAVVYGAVALLVMLVPIVTGPGTTLEYTTALIFGMVAVSLVVLSGWGGTVSLGQFAFAGAGGIVAGDLILKANVDLFQCLAVAAVVGAVLAAIVGLPAFRIRGEFLAVTTLAFAVCANSFFFNPTNFNSLIPGTFERPVLLGHINLNSGEALYYLCLAILVAIVLFVVGLRRARIGRVLLAVRDNAESAAAMGVPTVRVRLSAFMLAGGISGLAGALYLVTLRSAGVGTFDPSFSLLIFSMAVIGGLGSIPGALTGVALVQAATYSYPQYQELMAGVFLLVILMVLPGGLGEGIQRVRDALLRIVARRRSLHVPSLSTTAGANVVELADDTAPTLVPGLHELVAEADEGALDAVHEGAGSAAGAGSGTPVLVCRGIEASYGKVQILFGVDLEVQQGEIVALLGTNGAGKSTLLRAISGLLPVDEGSVQKSGSNIHGDSPESIAKRGMALVPGGRGVFPSLSVAENLRLAAWLIRGDAGAVQEARRRQFELFPVLASRLQQRAGDLSGGEQQMLSLAMALMVRPEILLIDELSLGLAPTVVAELLAIVRRLNAEGVTIVVVEQSISVALDLAERAVFMEKGEVRFTGDSPDLLSRPDLLRSVFIRGGPSSAAADHPMPPERVVAAADALGPIDPDAPLLSLRGVTKRFGGVTAANGVNMELRPHEILGLIGHNGAGKTTLMDIVSGFIPLDQGRIFCQGVDIGLMAPHERATLGMGRTFQNAGLFPSLTVKETLSVSYERHLVSRGLLAPGLRLPASLDAEADLAEEAEELLEFMGLVDYSEKLIGELSTGTRRIVELACVLAQRPAVLLLDEPSGGVAQRETEAMGPLLLEVRERTGCSILVVEHDMPLLAAICGRMIALELGEVIAEGTPREILEHPQVIASYLGSDTTAINRSAPGAVGQPIAAIR